MTKSNWMTTIYAAALAATFIPATTYGADSPHSRSSIGSIFSEYSAPGTSPVGRPGEADPSAKPVTLARVVDLLAEGNLDATIDGENAASLKMQHSRFSFPVAISLDADREKVKLEMVLTELDGQSAPASERLLGLLSANADFQPMFFSFEGKKKRLQLVSGVANFQVSSESLQGELSKMAAIAESTASLWESSTTSAPAAGTPAPSTQPVINNQAAPSQIAQSQPAASNNGFVGKWAASRSKTEAFAMQLNQDGSFVLVYVKDGKQSRSTGKFTATGNQLVLTTSDGGKFSGQVSNQTARSFDFSPPSNKATKLTFQRAS